MAPRIWERRVMAKRKNVKVALERVTRTDLICVSCNNFRTEWAIVPAPHGARASEDGAGGVEDAVAGVHTKCIDNLHVRFTRKKTAT